MKEKTVFLYAPDCFLSDWHAIDPGFKSMKEVDKRVLIYLGNDEIAVDSPGARVVPAFRFEDFKVQMDVSVQIDWVQNVDWLLWLLSAVMDRVRNEVNPKLPKLLFPVELPSNDIPVDKIIEQMGIKMTGCWLEENSRMELHIKFR